MMPKKQYTQADMQIIIIHKEDVLTASPMQVPPVDNLTDYDFDIIYE